MITFNCPHCGKALQVADQHAGSTGTCHFCKQAVTAPRPGPGTFAAVDVEHIEIDVDKPRPVVVHEPPGGVAPPQSPATAREWLQAGDKMANSLIQAGCAILVLPFILLLLAMFVSALFH